MVYIVILRIWFIFLFKLYLWGISKGLFLVWLFIFWFSFFFFFTFNFLFNLFFYFLIILVLRYFGLSLFSFFVFISSWRLGFLQGLAGSSPWALAVTFVRLPSSLLVGACFDSMSRNSFCLTHVCFIYFKRIMKFYMY